MENGVRRFPVVEKRWRSACKSENENENKASSEDDTLKYTVFPFLPTDSELVSSFVERKRR